MTLVLEIDASALNRSIGVFLSELGEQVRQALDDGAKDVARTARIEHSYRNQSGDLARSTQAEPATGQLFARTLEAVVSADAGHAAFVEFKTKPHKIRAKNARALRFQLGSGLVFAKSVNHPGTEAQPFLKPALFDELGHVAELVLGGAMNTFKMAGFDVELRA